jgi:hypothetical protein
MSDEAECSCDQDWIVGRNNSIGHFFPTSLESINNEQPQRQQQH